jgi:hypothetical protein
MAKSRATVPLHVLIALLASMTTAIICARLVMLALFPAQDRQAATPTVQLEHLEGLERQPAPTAKPESLLLLERTRASFVWPGHFRGLLLESVPTVLQARLAVWVLTTVLLVRLGFMPLRSLQGAASVRQGSTVNMRLESARFARLGR